MLLQFFDFTAISGFIKGTFCKSGKGSITDGVFVIDVKIADKFSLCELAEGTFATVQGLLVFKG